MSDHAYYAIRIQPTGFVLELGLVFGPFSPISSSFGYSEVHTAPVQLFSSCFTNNDILEKVLEQCLQLYFFTSE